MDKTINDRLKEARSALKLTQQEMADKIGIRKSYYSDIENKRRTLSNKILDKVCQAFPISKDWMYTGNGGMFVSHYNSDGVPFLSPKNVPSLSPSDKSQYNPRWENFKGMENFYLESHFEKKLVLELKNDNSDIGKLFWMVNNVIGFQYIIDNLRHYYFKEIEEAEHSANKFIKGNPTDYQEYKTHVIEVLGRYVHMLPALVKIEQAIKEFYADFQPLDSKNIIEGYFGKPSNES